jgi:hypothetical protein
VKTKEARLKEEQRLRKKLADSERALLAYYARKPGVSPDGSFMAHAYRLGYNAGRKREREAREGE